MSSWISKRQITEISWPMRYASLFITMHSNLAIPNQTWCHSWSGHKEACGWVDLPPLPGQPASRPIHGLHHVSSLLPLWFTSYEYMIQNVILLLKGTLNNTNNSVNIQDLIKKCHPLGLFKESLMRSICTFENTPSGYAELYSTVLIDTPVGTFCSSNSTASRQVFCSVLARSEGEPHSECIPMLTSVHRCL